MGKWSSFKEAQIIFENFRRFVNEEAQPEMDALLGAEYPEFVQWLGSNIKDPKTQALIGSGLKDGVADEDKFTFKSAAIPVSKLKPTQNEIDIDKSLAFPLVKTGGEGFIKNVSSDGPFTVGSPIITFMGKYVVDGHHRWSQLYACNKNASIDAVDVSIQGVDPLDALKAVQMAIGLQVKKIPVQSVKGTNLLNINEDGLKQWIQKNVSPKTTQKMYNAGEDFINKLKEAGGTSAGLANPSTEKSGHGRREAPMDERMLFEISKSRFHKMMVTQILPAYVWSNVASMRKTSQPVPGAGPRDFMPQTDNVPWQQPLKRGEVDIKPPYASKRDAE
jgi:hypothetical protein